jgi:hypothetical protein
MEVALLAQPIETRVALIENRQERTEKDVSALGTKIDKLILSALCAAVLLLVQIILTANGLLHPHGG